VLIACVKSWRRDYVSESMSFLETQIEEETGGYRKRHNRTRNNLCAVLNIKLVVLQE